MADCEAGSSGTMAKIECELRWDHESNHLLREELLEEILVRLPTTAVVRFQAVCKRWYSLISSPYFITRFRHHHTDDDVESSLVFRFRYRQNCNHSYFDQPPDCNQCNAHFQIISNSSSSLLQKVYRESTIRLSYLSLSPIEFRNLRFEGSFSDLILCSSYLISKKIDYYVSNPLTRQWIALPPVARQDVVTTGFLCVEDNKFMVVRLFTDHFSTPRSWGAQVFSSENRLWRTLVVSSPLTLKQDREGIPLVAYRGMLHWLNFDCIVVYDPLNTPERFSRVIHLPITIVPRNIYTNNCLGVSQGCLRVTEVLDKYSIDPILDVWELEDYDSGLWILVHKVHLRDLIHNGLLESLQYELRCFSVLSFHPENGDLIYLRLRNGVAPINMKSGVIERFYPMNESAMLSWTGAFHVVDQPWPTPVSSLPH